MITNSQSGQDIFVSKLINNKNAFFVDIGCWKPIVLNNTFMLEELGWKGISLDITDMTDEWSIRKTGFIKADALNIDYTKLFNDNNLPLVIDYLTIDIEGNGHRLLALKKIFESNREFKIITIEHDFYRGYEKSETIPQRQFLINNGYFLLCSNVCLSNNPFEDWWINPKFFIESEFSHLKCNNTEYSEILKRFDV